MQNQELTGFKEEGKAGLAYCYSESGIYTPASKAKHGAKYTCPICGAKMHLTRTKKGKYIFARNSGEVHSKFACITIEKSGKERSFAGLEPESFIAGLCRSSPRSSGRINHTSNDDVTSNASRSAGISTETEDFSLVCFKNLKEIADSGIENLNSDDRQGTHKISDFVMTFRYARNFFNEPSFILGARIVYARFAFYDFDNHAIIFSLFSHDFSVKFHVFFKEKSDFKHYLDILIENKITEDGKTVTRKKEGQNVLIASEDWIFFDEARCKKSCIVNEKYCKNCAGMYHTKFTSRKQIYVCRR